MPKPNALTSALLAVALLAASTWAISQQATALPDFNGLWRLSDQGSDGPDQVTAMLRSELRREQSPTVAPASASSSASTSQPSSHGGHGGGRGGMGGGGMGGGHMGGGHGRGGNKTDSTSSSNSSDDADLLKLPPTLANDSVLIVQQDANALQARLENGEQLAMPLNGHDQHTLDGNAIAHRLDAGQDLQFTLQFNDGSHLDEIWSRSADGHTLQVTEQWQPGFLQRPVVFHRNYVRVDQ
ncbi:hypothetical protein IHE49_17075 [Rhodanobacter sp. 7MK24]|uniref:hypothetical protein n=1 Tax=Rhodanobacter sp. 7MK24 TaxID=2775922 RepID=UPI001785F807|nr:hypothetical protein [Rhodanobacter sp. 7MK24]MBD8882198.1 hypothetical protein [Rhodanobacter sp. 7MK24]